MLKLSQAQSDVMRNSTLMPAPRPTAVSSGESTRLHRAVSGAADGKGPQLCHGAGEGGLPRRRWLLSFLLVGRRVLAIDISLR
jgi:hypothetical protein